MFYDLFNSLLTTTISFGNQLSTYIVLFTTALVGAIAYYSLRKVISSIS